MHSYSKFSGLLNFGYMVMSKDNICVLGIQANTFWRVHWNGMWGKYKITLYSVKSTSMIWLLGPLNVVDHFHS